MTEITINRTCAMLDRCEQFTSGRVGARIKFSFSSEWAGLSKTAVFTNGDTTIDVLNVADEITIPHEVLAISGKKLKVGVYGYTVGDNGNIEIAIPTVYADLGKVVKGADPSGDESTEPSLPVWAQTQALIGNLSELETEAKNNLVAAINEAAQTGSGGGSTVELDTTLTQSGKAADAKAVGDALAGKQNTISDLEAIRTGAAKGATALQSVPSTYRTASEQDTIDNGKVDKVTGKGLSSNDYTDAAKAKVDALAPVATSGSYNDLTNKPTIPTALPNPNALTFTGAVTGSYDGSAPLSVEIPSGGGSGSDISLGLTGATVGQIAKITAVDDTGKPTAWEPVDMPSGGGERTFEKVVEMTTAEDAAVISISTDKNGNPLSMPEFYVAITTARNSEATKNSYFNCNVLPDTVPSYIRNKCAINNIMLYQDVYCYVMHYKVIGGMIVHEYTGRARTHNSLNVAKYLENEKEISLISDNRETTGFLSPIYATNGVSKIDSAGKMYCITFGADSTECIFGAGTRVEVWAR